MVFVINMLQKIYYVVQSKDVIILKYKIMYVLNMVQIKNVKNVVLLVMERIMEMII